MANRQQQTPDVPSINVGVYGCTAAGKTRFLFELLRKWERGHRLLSQSETCQQFLGTVEKEILKYNRSMGTTASVEGIEVRVSHGNKEPAQDWIFRDLRGELLSNEVDQIDSIRRDSEIPRQVEMCDGFLFFFDPSCSESSQDLEKHQKRELERADRFMEYVLKTRQNHHLPIIFVLTHLDVWKNKESIRRMAYNWVDQVLSRLQDQYSGQLNRHYPAKLVAKEIVMRTVSSTESHGVEEVAEHLVELVISARKFTSEDRRKVWRFLIGGIACIVVMVGVFALWVVYSDPETHPASPASSRADIASWDDETVTAQLDQLEKLLSSHPPGNQLPTVEEANKIGDHLKWLPVRIETAKNGAGGMPEVTRSTRTRMEAILNTTADLVLETVP